MISLLLYRYLEERIPLLNFVVQGVVIIVSTIMANVYNQPLCMIPIVSVMIYNAIDKEET